MGSSNLDYAVFVSDGPVRAGEQRMPDGSKLVWNPLSSVLVTGRETALLIDPPFTRTQIGAVGDWIEQSGKRLTHIYATHGHGDHWFGGPELVKRFPSASMYATPGTIDMMHKQATTGREQLWDINFPDQIPETPVIAQPVGAEGMELEGEKFLPIELGHTDTDDTTALHVPSIGLVAAGDSVYNGVHQYLLEGRSGGFELWLSALDTVESLQPRYVVAGHKNRDLPDSPEAIDTTRRYLQDVITLIAEGRTAQEFFDGMIERYSTWINQSPLWYGALGILGG